MDKNYELIVIPSTGKEYKIVFESVKWPAAVQGAVIKGGKLAQFETEIEAQNFWEELSKSDFIKDIENENNKLPSASKDGEEIKYLWLGATDKEQEGEWLWNEKTEDGYKLSLDNPRWGKNQPDNFSESEDALALALEEWPKNSNEREIIINAGQWNDLNGMENKLYYLVEGIFEKDEVMYINSSTGEKRTLSQMQENGWILLSEEDYPTKYKHPALYSFRPLHKVLDMSGTLNGGEVGGWRVESLPDLGETELTKENDGDSQVNDSKNKNSTLNSGNNFDNDQMEFIDVRYYNKKTEESKTLTEMIADGWSELDEAEHGDKYQYPAIYSGGSIKDVNGNGIHGTLDMSEGDQVGDWIVKSTIVEKPYQTISATSEEITFSPGGDVSFDIIYTTSDNNSLLTGLGLNIHYDSSIFTPLGDNDESVSGVTTSLKDNLAGAPSINDDDVNKDFDLNTDKYISISWFDLTGNFPGSDLPGKIANIQFSSSKEGLDQLTGESKINFTANTTAQNYNFLPQSVVLKPQTYNLDVDGNGEVTALGDGLMIIRKLFGSSFDGEKLTDKAISKDATRDHQDVHQYIQNGKDSLALDVDGNGEVTALGDGLMILRKLFGSSFDGAKLTDKAISQDATRDHQGCHDYIESLMLSDMA